MTRSHAAALAQRTTLHVHRDEPERDRRALRALAGRLARRYSPIVAVDPPDGVLMDITGCAHLFGGEAAMRDDLLRALRAMRLSGVAAIASTYACARAVARHGREHDARIIGPGDERDALAPLPIRALGLDDDICDALDDIGVERIEHLIDLPRSELARRFGYTVLRRLDQALGEAMESIDPVPHHRTPAVQRVFSGGVVQIDVLEHAARELLDELLDVLQQRETGIRRLTMTLQRLDLPPGVIEIDVSAPTRHHDHLWSLLQPRLVEMHLGHGVEVIDLRAARTGTLAHRQHTSWIDVDCGAHRDAERATGELLDTLTTRIGRAGVLRLMPSISHQPASHHLFRSATDMTPTTAYPDPFTADRPSRLYEEPIEITMHELTDAGHPKRWSRAGRTTEARRTIGPETIAREWWRDRHDALLADGTRDYFMVQDDAGCWHWLFAVRETGFWWAHGDWA